MWTAGRRAFTVDRPARLRHVRAMGLTSAIKWLRASQPFNAAATAALSAVLPAGGAREFARRHLPRMGHVRARLPNGSDLRVWSRGDDGVANDLFWGGFA